MEFNSIKTGFFSMEIGLKDSIPTFAGGLGVLAGDALKSCADLQLPVGGLTLLYRKGYFRQRIEQGRQTEEEQSWDPSEELKKLDNRVVVRIKGEDVHIGCWMYELEGVTGQKRPVLFLDPDTEQNSDYFRRVCDRLYQGDQKDRIAQEMILGIGGVKMLQSLGYSIEKYHMNEGHTSFLALELLRKLAETSDDYSKRLDSVRSMCVFTTHTPVPAGHDRFDKGLVTEMAGEYLPPEPEARIFDGNELNMTHLGLRFSGYINGVARKHSRVSKKMFPEHDIESITNGVHLRTWISEPFRKLFDRYIMEWQEDPFSLRAALNIPEQDIWDAHMCAKKMLLDDVNERTGIGMDMDAFTIGFARRFVMYKRPDLIFHDLERLRKIAREKGAVQIIFSGKAHPGDSAGKGLIDQITDIQQQVNQADDNINVAFLDNYNMKIAKRMISGCDIWLNNPRRPHEASGTSGMKAALNGVPHFSTLDGWWLEGHIEDITGWCIGLHPKDPKFDEDVSPDDEAEDFYDKLESNILPVFYDDKDRWQKIMRNCIAINGSFFNTHRMMQQYVMEAYFK
ncbi:alpha-glucan family phosphorylase [Candidatus Woesearchaeota archaeon]|nr:alpha-glucan family phosphorylase [Candidatus Woesearchaeota archaeon]